jgi:hypothetical protein
VPLPQVQQGSLGSSYLPSPFLTPLLRSVQLLLQQFLLQQQLLTLRLCLLQGSHRCSMALLGLPVLLLLQLQLLLHLHMASQAAGLSCTTGGRRAVRTMAAVSCGAGRLNHPHLIVHLLLRSSADRLGCSSGSLGTNTPSATTPSCSPLPTNPVSSDGAGGTPSCSGASRSSTPPTIITTAAAGPPPPFSIPTTRVSDASNSSTPLLSCCWLLVLLGAGGAVHTTQGGGRGWEELPGGDGRTRS